MDSNVEQLAVADATSFRQAMRMLTGAVCIIASGPRGGRVGLTATAVCSVTAAPPRLLVCLNKDSSAQTVMSEQGRLSVNVLAAGQLGLAKRFAGMIPGVVGEDRFAEGRWVDHAALPVLADACAAFVCRVAEVWPQSSHNLFLCDVEAVHSHGSESKRGLQGLLYFDGRFRHLAPVTSDERTLIEWIW